MRYAEILRTLTEEPLLIAPSAHASLMQLFQQHATLDAIEFRAKREGIDFCGNEVELDQAGLIEGTDIYRIPIGGPLGIGFGKFEKGAGAVDYGDLSTELNEANKDSRVKKILLDVDSPGGMVSGTPEFADKLNASEKEIYTFTGGTMASAAYWIGCTAERIFATKSADIGSIGVYTYFLDSSKALEEQGLKLDVIASGPFKGAGIPGTSLTEAQRGMLQERVQQIAVMFQEHVLQMRGLDLDPSSMQGQTFMSPFAIQQRLIDEIVSDRDEAIQIISSL